MSVLERPAALREQVGTYPVATGGELFAKTLSREGGQGGTLLLVHGGGSGGNHSMLVRPAAFLLGRGLFSRAILPDRRGSGASSPLLRRTTFAEGAADLSALLDAMGERGPVAALGISYGGPVVLELAARDARVSQVVLVCSSPSLRAAKGLKGFLYRTGLLGPLVAKVYGRLVGSADPRIADFDPIYEARRPAEIRALFLDAIKRTPRARLESLLLENASTLDLANQGIGAATSVAVPVLRVIGDRDEIWEVRDEGRYADRIPRMRTVLVPGARHQDCFFRAPEFYEAVARELAAG